MYAALNNLHTSCCVDKLRLKINRPVSRSILENKVLHNLDHHCIHRISSLICCNQLLFCTQKINQHHQNTWNYNRLRNQNKLSRRGGSTKEQRKLKDKKAAGKDAISNELLKYGWKTGTPARGSSKGNYWDFQWKCV